MSKFCLCEKKKEIQEKKEGTETKTTRKRKKGFRQTRAPGMATQGVVEMENTHKITHRVQTKAWPSTVVY